jgi:hypothetical protein
MVESHKNQLPYFMLQNIVVCTLSCEAVLQYRCIISDIFKGKIRQRHTRPDRFFLTVSPDESFSFDFSFSTLFCVAFDVVVVDVVAVIDVTDFCIGWADGCVVGGPGLRFTCVQGYKTFLFVADGRKNKLERFSVTSWSPSGLKVMFPA